MLHSVWVESHSSAQEPGGFRKPTVKTPVFVSSSQCLRVSLWACVSLHLTVKLKILNYMPFQGSGLRAQGFAARDLKLVFLHTQTHPSERLRSFQDFLPSLLFSV